MLHDKRLINTYYLFFVVVDCPPSPIYVCPFIVESSLHSHFIQMFLLHLSYEEWVDHVLLLHQYYRKKLLELLEIHSPVVESIEDSGRFDQSSHLIEILSF